MRGLLVILPLFALLPLRARALPAGDEVRVSGASNIRAFTCRSQSVGKSLELRADASAAALLEGEPVVRGAVLEIPSGSFHCGIAQMNRHLRHTLHAREHPLIRFRLASYTLSRSDSGTAATLDGSVEIAGTARPVRISGALHLDSLGEVRLRGTLPLRPTEFGVRPPRRFLGLLRVRDSVTVRFDVAVAPGRPDPLVAAGIPGGQPPVRSR